MCCTRIPASTTTGAKPAFSTRTLLFAMLLLCGLLSGCGDQEAALPATLRVGVLPDASPELLRLKHSPLLEYLHGKTGIPTELVIPRDYDELLAMFHDKAIDLAFFGAYTYVLAHDRDHAVPLVMRDIDIRFTSVFLVRTNDPATTLADLKGKRFTFGSRLSTSGHLMARYFLNEHHITPETFFGETLYSGAHDTTAYWIRDGKVDAGAANSEVIRNMFKSGQLGPGDVRILWESPAYADYVWAAQAELNPALQRRIVDSLLALSMDHPDQRRILEAIGAQRKFLPALDRDFSMAREAINLIDQAGTKE